MLKARLNGFSNQTLRAVSFLVLFSCAVSGCAMVGPKSISMGRADYNEAINKTEDEQMLMAIIKGRYGESHTLLAVSGVAANVRFASRAGAQVGIGPSQSFQGNLIPLGGGLAYEENPTITYAPVQGERYLRQVLSPIPLEVLVLLMRSATAGRENYLVMLARRINDLRNPDFLTTPSAKQDDRFQQFVELNKKLSEAGVLQWMEDPREDVPFDVLITGHTRHDKQVNTYLKLLGLSIPGNPPEDIIIPVYFSIKRGEWDGIAISTRSTADLVQILRAAIHVPKEHMDAGLAYPSPPVGLAGKNLHIHTSKETPEAAAVSVKYRGYWFYIDETDMHTKLFYQMVRRMWSVSIAAGADQRAAPVLTIPVSR